VGSTWLTPPHHVWAANAGSCCCAAGGIDKGDNLKGPRNWLCSSRQLLRGSGGSLAITSGPDRCIFRFFLRHAVSVPPPCSPATPINSFRSPSTPRDALAKPVRLAQATQPSTRAQHQFNPRHATIFLVRAALIVRQFTWKFYSATAEVFGEANTGASRASVFVFSPGSEERKQ
jgi:hypothetical protein